MNEVMWREVMDSCNRDAPCRLDLTLATPLVAQGAVRGPALLTCGPEIRPVLGQHVKVWWEELGCPCGARGALPKIHTDPIAVL